MFCHEQSGGKRFQKSPKATAAGRELGTWENINYLGASRRNGNCCKVLNCILASLCQVHSSTVTHLSCLMEVLSFGGFHFAFLRRSVISDEVWGFQSPQRSSHKV